jgi:multicomponent K+:H+ antiporter subunit D
VQYVVINLAGSTLFLIAVGTIYAVTGTLNMADLAVKVPLVPAGDQALLRVGALLLLVVFAVKAALVPIHFWLPGTYANAPAPVAALFAIMTKVGAYSIIRVFTLVFGGEDAWLAADWLLPAALVTLIVGNLGILGATALTRLICFSVIGSMGTLLTAVALFTPAATVAALFYLIHSTFAGAALFLVNGLIVERRGSAGDRLVTAPRLAANGGLLAALFFLAAIGMAGMPPLTGFLGKLMVLDSARDSASMVTIWTVILITSLISIVGFARAGSLIFWKSAGVPGPAGTAATEARHAAPHSGLPIAAAGAMLAAMVALTVFAGPVTGYLEATADGLYDRGAYIRAVLGADAGIVR